MRQRLTVQHYFERALRRAPSRGTAGSARPSASAPDGSIAEFEVQIAGDRISGIDYRCTPCVTLIALCEHLREALLGAPVADGVRCGPGFLLDLHPEIPSEKRGRAQLACHAFGLALNEAITGRNE